MSASNWARCPRCAAEGEAALRKRATEVDQMYGTVSVGEFDEARADLEKARQRFAEREQTFREDYEFYGAEEGIVHADYSGHCEACGLSLNFEHKHPLYPEKG